MLVVRTQGSFLGRTFSFSLICFPVPGYIDGACHTIITDCHRQTSSVSLPKKQVN